MSKEKPDNPEKEEVARKSLLEMTADDHLAIGSTPDEILTQNPGKSMGEIMNEREIAEYLEEQFEAMETLKSFHPDLIERTKRQLRSSLDYLKSIGKLPKEFEGKEIK